MIAQPQQHSLDFAEPSVVPVALTPVVAPVVPLATVLPAATAEVLPEPTLSPLPAADELWAALQFDAGGESLTLAERDARRAELITRAHTFTPRVSFESPDALLFELAGSCRLFGGLRPLLQRLREVFPAPFALAIAPRPAAALVFARAGRTRCITSHARLASRLAPLPLSLLRWPEKEIERLRSMGVTTFGELLRLPREGLARRLGPAFLSHIDRLTGRRADPRETLRPVERFAERIDAGYETRDVQRLLVAITPTLDRLEDFLRARQRGVRAVRLVFAHRNLLPTVMLLRLVVPDYRAARLAALLTARLESLPMPGPVQRIDLATGRLQRLPGDSVTLWRPGEQGGDGAAIATPEFLQTLMARLGEQAVYGLAVVPGHRPELQGRSVWPGVQPRTGSPESAVAMPDYRRRPLGLLQPPQPISAQAIAPGRTRLRYDGCVLQLVTGPERIESGWWDGGDVARDYYVARARGGALWWVFRECEGERSWYAHGCFA